MKKKISYKYYWIPAFAGMTFVYFLYANPLANGKSLYSQGRLDEAVSTFLNYYQENPFTKEGIEASNLAKKIFRSKMAQTGKGLFLEAYALEEHNPRLAREKYNQILDILEESEVYYQKSLKRIRALPE